MKFEFKLVSFRFVFSWLLKPNRNFLISSFVSMTYQNYFEFVGLHLAKIGPMVMLYFNESSTYYWCVLWACSYARLLYCIILCFTTNMVHFFVSFCIACFGSVQPHYDDRANLQWNLLGNSRKSDNEQENSKHAKQKRAIFVVKHNITHEWKAHS